MLHTTRPRTLRAASILGVSLLLGLLTACTTDGNSTYARMCEEKATGQRTTDSNCKSAPATVKNDDDANSLYLWYYVLNTSTYSAPAVGSRLTGGSTTEPEDGEEIDENIDEDGGEITDDDTTQEQAPDTDEDDGSGVNQDDDDDSGSISDNSGDDDDSSSFSDAGDDD